MKYNFLKTFFLILLISTFFWKGLGFDECMAKNNNRSNIIPRKAKTTSKDENKVALLREVQNKCPPVEMSAKRSGYRGDCVKKVVDEISNSKKKQ